VIILTGFEPFNGRGINRSWQAVEAVRAEVERVQLPVDFEKLAQLVPELVARRPRALVLVGEAPYDRVTVESIALNIIHDQRADNAGRRGWMEPIRAGRPLALPATWDARRLLRAIDRTGIAVEISHHAGTYACNAALYHALDAAADLGLAAPIGFLHVPSDGIAVDRLTAAIEALIGALG
jgi:pyroglutamyl-peptidase